MGTITRPGYEFVYRFCVDEELLTRHQEHTSYTSYFLRTILLEMGTIILLEVRTNFKFKRNCGVGPDEIMGTERFGAFVPVKSSKELLEVYMRYRLEEYWMPDDGIRSLVQGAFDFVRRLLPAEPNYYDVIPFVVCVDVCTVQLEDEPLVATIDRSIDPNYLIPIHMWPFDRFSYNKTELIDLDLKSFLLDLPRIRVENVDKGLAAMDVCPICLHGPTVGAQISLLPDCNHAFHNHCILRWLLKTKSCPLCRSQVQTKKK